MRRIISSTLVLLCSCTVVEETSTSIESNADPLAQDEICSPSLQVRFLPLHGDSIPAGSDRVPLHAMGMSASCEDVPVSLLYVLTSRTPDALDPGSDFCALPCNSPQDWNFRHFRVQDPRGETLLPIHRIFDPSQNSVALSSLGHQLTVPKDGPALVVLLEADIPDPLPSAAAHGKTFDIELLKFGTSAELQIIDPEGNKSFFGLE